MQPNLLLKAGVLALVIVLGSLVSWELYLRSKGYLISYDENEALWSDKRARVYQPANKATVFIGSSRIKYDLDIPTWEKRTGHEAVQLANAGSSPLPALTHLAEDENFKGNLVIDVTEILFFNKDPMVYLFPNKNVSYYNNRTPSQKASFQINRMLESKLVFLDKDYFSLNAYLLRLGLKDRPGIYGYPIFPADFDNNTFGRQSKMTDRFVKDTNLQNQVRGIWYDLSTRSKEPPMHGGALDSVMLQVKRDVDRLKERGVQVFFVRTPSSGPFLQGEKAGFPRQQYWDRLLAVTGCEGIHFEDYASIANFQCPEFSHLSPADAVVFTEHFIDILKQKGFRFSTDKLALQSAQHKN